MRGRFITFEGIDGAGKSTHIHWLAEHLRHQGKTVVTTREPGGTPLGEKLRELLLHQSMHLETETLLMFAARREHLIEVIEPALARGDWVISDRFTDATFAYQGGGRGLSSERLETLEQWVQGRLQPDLTLLFDVPLAVAQERMHATRVLDRFESEAEAFHQRVRQAYLTRAVQSRGRIQVLSGERGIAELQTEISTLIAGLG